MWFIYGEKGGDNYEYILNSEVFESIFIWLPVWPGKKCVPGSSTWSLIPIRCESVKWRIPTMKHMGGVIIWIGTPLKATLV